MRSTPNVDPNTVEGFGHEWETFDQEGTTTVELQRIFDEYFAIFPWQMISTRSRGADFGCGSGRWSRLLAPRVKELFLIDASPRALDTARRNLAGVTSARFHQGSIETFFPADGALDFAFSLGVLHHLPDTQQALCDIARTLKPGAPFLVYLYYAFDNRPFWYSTLWKATDVLRRILSRLPFGVRALVARGIALTLYWPLARLARVIERLGFDASPLPLSYYRQRSFYIMQNDALDRFGTRLEKRYTRKQIKSMLEVAGFGRVEFSPHAPYWCAIAYKE